MNQVARFSALFHPPVEEFQPRCSVSEGTVAKVVRPVLKSHIAKETIGKLSLDLGHAYGIFGFGEGATWEALYEVREWRTRLEEVHWALIAAAGDDSIPDELMHP